MTDDLPSSSTENEYYCPEWALDELGHRYGDPLIRPLAYAVSFGLPSGRQISLQRTRTPTSASTAKVWFEYLGNEPETAELPIEHYVPPRGRNSNLASRLAGPKNAANPASVTPWKHRHVYAVSQIADRARLKELLDAYEAEHFVIDLAALEKIRMQFEARCGGAVDLRAGEGEYWERERGFKNAALDKVQTLLNTAWNSPREAGEALLDAMTAKGAAFFARWENLSIANAGRENAAVALGELILTSIRPGPKTREADVYEAAAACAATIHRHIVANTGKPAYGTVRTIVTTATALIRPDVALAIKTDYLNAHAKALIGKPLFRSEVMTAAEYRRASYFAFEIGRIMNDEWNWQPRDLWDVQGMLWMTSGAYDDEPMDTLEQMESTTMPGPGTSTNLILYGPPGTGKTFATTERAVILCDGEAPATRTALMARYRELVADGRIAFVTFHQSYAYEDFVEGLRPETDAGGAGFSLRPRDGVFKSVAALAQAASADAESAPAQFVLIIDEINRANISKVFGELITLLEPDKRLGRENELTVTLPYSGERFGVPANLHVIGTMNTADRSIALLDTALRRRFRFEELMPEPERLRAASQLCGVDLVGKLRGINARIEYLFDREHQIGHAYFMSCVTAADVDAVMRDAVIPLLAEYFFDDWEKIQLVLADDFLRYVEARELPSPRGDGEPRWSYRIRPKALSATLTAAPAPEIALVPA